MGSVLEADTIGTFSLGEDKEKPHGKGETLGKRPQGM